MLSRPAHIHLWRRSPVMPSFPQASSNPRHPGLWGALPMPAALSHGQRWLGCVPPTQPGTPGCTRRPPIPPHTTSDAPAGRTAGCSRSWHACQTSASTTPDGNGHPPPTLGWASMLGLEPTWHLTLACVALLATPPSSSSQSSSVVQRTSHTERK